jgi:hypothetical protein
MVASHSGRVEKSVAQRPASDFLLAISAVLRRNLQVRPDSSGSTVKSRQTATGARNPSTEAKQPCGPGARHRLRFVDGLPESVADRSLTAPSLARNRSLRCSECGRPLTDGTCLVCGVAL